MPRRAPLIEADCDACTRSRVLAGYSVRQAAEKLSVTAAHLSYVETGGRRPSPSLLRRMADLYGVDINTLFTFADDAA